MKEKSPLFTVIIPVKNRAHYLQQTLRTCMAQDYERLEILVSDDGSTDNTREVVEDASRRDSRIRYIKPSSGKGMLNNFEYALQQAKPGFVMALGGDDGLLPDGIKEMSEVLRDTSMNLLSWSAPTYYYPNVIGEKGQLTIYRDKKIKIINSNDYLNRQATTLRYSSDRESPMFYVKGVVSTELIDRVRKRSSDGRFYSCSTPDGYSGIVLAGEVDFYAHSGKPFSLYGASPSSHGLTYVSNNDKAKKISEEFFKNASEVPMHPELANQPYSPLISLMTIDFLLTAKDLPGWNGNFPPINFREVITKSIMELSSGAYGDQRIGRELVILSKIAKMHGLVDFFDKKVKNSKCYKQRKPFNGNGINTDKFYLDADAFRIKNIFDAAYAVQNICKIYSDLSFKSVSSALGSSLNHRFRAMQKGNPFPKKSEW